MPCELGQGDEGCISNAVQSTHRSLLLQGNPSLGQSRCSWGEVSLGPQVVLSPLLSLLLDLKQVLRELLLHLLTWKALCHTAWAQIQRLLAALVLDYSPVPSFSTQLFALK